MTSLFFFFFFSAQNNPKLTQKRAVDAAILSSSDTMLVVRRLKINCLDQVDSTVMLCLISGSFQVLLYKEYYHYYPRLFKKLPLSYFNKFIDFFGRCNKVCGLVLFPVQCLVYFRINISLLRVTLANPSQYQWEWKRIKNHLTKLHAPGSFLVVFNPLIPRVKPWVMQSFLSFDPIDTTLKCDHSLESC